MRPSFEDQLARRLEDLAERAPTQPSGLPEYSETGSRTRSSRLVAIVAAALVVIVGAAVALIDRDGPTQTATGNPSEVVVPVAAEIDVVEVICTGFEITASTPVVVARADGVHIEFDNLTDESIVFDIGGGGGGVEPGHTTQVRGIPPGVYQMGCRGHGPSTTEHSVTIQIDDPHGYYTPGDIDCLGGGIGHLYPTPHEGATAREAAEDALEFYSGEASIEQAGYQDQDWHWVARTSTGRVIATASARAEADGFVAMVGSSCPVNTQSDPASSEGGPIIGEPRPAPQAEPALPGTLTVDAFSGLPNPVLELGPLIVEDALGLVDTLAISADTREPGGLGFRGLVLSVGDGRTLAASRDLVTTWSPDGWIEFRADPDGSVLRLLAEAAIGASDADGPTAILQDVLDGLPAATNSSETS